MGQWNCETCNALKPLLISPNITTLFVIILLIDVILPKGKYRNKAGIISYSQFDKAKSFLQSKVICARSRAQRFRPRDIIKSRYNGNRKLDANVNKDGTIPGYCWENPVASVAKLANAAIDIIPWG
jgi:hypothetical protein